MDGYRQYEHIIAVSFLELDKFGQSEKKESYLLPISTYFQPIFYLSLPISAYFSNYLSTHL